MNSRSLFARASKFFHSHCYLRIVVLSVVLCAPASHAQLPANVSTGSSDTAAADTADQTPTQADINELARLLGDQRIANWLKEQAKKTDKAQVDKPKGISIRDSLRKRLDSIRSRATDIASAGRSVPDVPNALSRAWMTDVQPGDALRSVVYTIIFIFTGAGLEWLFWRYMAATRRSIEFSNKDSLSQSMRRAAQRGGLIVVGVLIFALGCIGSFLFFFMGALRRSPGSWIVNWRRCAAHYCRSCTVSVGTPGE